MIGLFAFAAAATADQAVDIQYSRKVMRDFARCTVKYEHELARKFVLLNSWERLPDSEYQKVVDSRCLGLLGGRLFMRPFQYRAAIAERLISKDSVRLSENDVRSRAPLDWSVPQRTVSDAAGISFSFFNQIKELDKPDYLAAESAMGRLGECVVRANPRGALAVLETRKDAYELAAMRALAPQLAACVQPNEKMTFAPSNLRDAIALSYYRLAMETPAPQEPGKSSPMINTSGRVEH